MVGKLAPFLSCRQSRRKCHLREVVLPARSAKPKELYGWIDLGDSLRLLLACLLFCFLSFISSIFKNSRLYSILFCVVSMNSSTLSYSQSIQ